MKRVAVLLCVLAMVACRNENQQATATTDTAAAVATDTASATNPGSPGGTALVPSTAAGTTVIITLGDGTLAVQNPDTIPPGPAILTITNGGKGVHNLYVEGEGINRGPEKTLPAGGTTSLDVVFKPGTYTLYCPVLKHRQSGESVTLIIKPASAPAPTSTVVPNSPTSTGTTKT